MTKPMVFLALGAAATLLAPWRGWCNSEADPSVVARAAICQPKIHRQPNGPFAVIGFCEDAHADHIGVIYYEAMRGLMDGAWSITDRFWQQQEWAADVTSFAWGPDGNSLFVGTSEVYGSGDLFVLDLRERKVHTIAPKSALRTSDKRDEGYEIRGFDSDRRFLLYGPGDGRYALPSSKK